MKKSQVYLQTIYLLLFLSLLLNCSILVAQSGNETYRHISTRDGLSSGFVWDMMEDHNGYIWIASNVGLDMYNGYSVTSYRNDPSDPTTITGGNVFSILDDNNERFWIATGSGLSIMDPVTGIFKQVQISGEYQPISAARDIKQADNGDIWVGDQNGIYRFPRQNFSADTLITELFVDVFEDTMSSVTALAVQDQTLWVGTDTNLHKFDLNSKEFTELPEFDEDFTEVIRGTIWDLLTDSNGTLWISSNAGLAKWPKGADSPEVIKKLGPYDEETFGGAFFQSLSEDHEKNLWISTGYLGAIRYNLETGNVKTFRQDDENSNTIQEDDVHYAFVDGSGNTWFGYHTLGISIMYSQAWVYSYQQVSEEYDDEDHPLNFIHAYLEDDVGNGWFATHWGLGLIPADGSEFQYFPLYPNNLAEDDNENATESISISGNQIFVLTHSDELHVFDMEDQTFEQVELPQDIPDIFMMSSTYATNDNHFYIGSVNDQLLRINKSTFEVSALDIPQRDTEDVILQTATFPLVDREGNLYIRFFYAASG
ncbi:MAG: two-component regulator propeller domain-containing protein, partial [Balneolaceae bacterium]|nr:two-component regulator propeller domain-containing protein [Balneolaceae bacterium]